MFVYEKKLQYPVKVKNTNPKLASVIISQYGGPYYNRLRKNEGDREIHRNFSPSLSLSKNSTLPRKSAFK